MRHSLNAGFLSPEDLAAKGIPDAAERNILIHSTCVILDFARLRLGRNIRIDPYCVITCARLDMGDHIHISSGVSFSGGGVVTVADFATISNQCLIFTSSDDYSGAFMANPMVPSRFTNVDTQDVTFGRHSLLGARCTVLPGAILEEGVSVGVGALIKGRLPAWTLYVGVPAKPLRPRSRDLLALETTLLAEQAAGRGQNG
jgi:dTDP-4-amino-4,6-dideoxy-D-glucose acyltransferase